MKKIFFACFIIVIVIVVTAVFAQKKTSPVSQNLQKTIQKSQQSPYDSYPLSVASMRAKSYPGSDIKIEQTLDPGTNYNRYIVSYLSDGLKIYALLTIPQGNPPAGGFPAIVFNHGYIPPQIYSPTERYIAYTDAFSRDGYVVLKSNYRGNGQSEGSPQGAYYAPGYTTDVMNALSSIKKLKGPSMVNSTLLIVNPDRIGMWGHSMGGNITLRALEISPDIKAAVIWGGVVGSYNDLVHNWQRRVSYQPPPYELNNRNSGRAQLIKQYGDPSANGSFWQAIDPTQHLDLITAPVQLHVGSADEEVPPDFSGSLYTKLQALGKPVEFYSYEGSDHNILQGFDLAIQRSVAFFDKYLK